MSYSYINEVTGLGKGLGSVGSKISKSAGLPGLDVSSNTKALAPPQQAQPQEAPPDAQGAPPEDFIPGEEEEQGPETVEKLPKPEELKYDKMGSPDKHKLVGHTVMWDNREYVLDWDDEFEVYKVVDPETLRVKTRVKPDSISVVDYKEESIRDAISEAVGCAAQGIPIESLVEHLLDG